MLEFFKRALVALIKARQAEADRRIAMMQLGRMSDRELNDIGIGRADIRRVVYEDAPEEEYISKEAKVKEYSKFGWELHKANHA